MKRPLVGVLSTLLLAGTLLTGTGQASATTPDKDTPKTAAANFAGTVALSNCSGSLVRMPTSQPSDPALVLSNGHCIESGFPSAGEVIVNQASSRSFTLLRADSSAAGTLRATKIMYATMTDTDVSLYQLNTTYTQIEQQYQIQPLTLSGSHPTAGRPISVVSGYWKRIYNCSIDGFAYQLRESQWTWKDSVRYTKPGCEIIGGTSGSPVIDTTTNQVVAVNNTINESGGNCTLNNPCEVDQNGNTTIHPGTGYAQQTHHITTCITTGNTLNLNSPSCTLPKP